MPLHYELLNWSMNVSIVYKHKSNNDFYNIKKMKDMYEIGKHKMSQLRGNIKSDIARHISSNMYYI